MKTNNPTKPGLGFVDWLIVPLLCLLFCCTACIGPKLEELDFVEVQTKIPIPAGVGSLTLGGSIKRTLLEEDSLADHGFIWAENWTETAADFVLGKPGVQQKSLGKIQQGDFKSFTLNNLNAEQSLYSIKAYAVSGGRTIYGGLERFSFNFVVQTDTVSINNNEATLSALLFGLEALRDSVIDHGHIIARDTANLYANKTFFKKSSLKSTNDDGVFSSEFEGLSFNTTYYGKAYAQTRDGRFVYSKKILPFRVRDGWLPVKVRLPAQQAHLVSGAIGNSGFMGVACLDESCLIATNGPSRTAYRFEVERDTVGKWTEIADYSGIPARRSTSFTLNNRLYVTLGDRGSGNRFNTTTIWALDPAENGGEGSWILADTFPATGREGAVAFVINGKAYIGSGRSLDATGNEVLYSDFYEYSPALERGQRWQKIASLPGSGRSEAAAFVVNNRGYVGTGFSSRGGDLSDFWSYNPQSNQWAAVDSLPYDPRRGAISFSINGKGYVGTGWKSENSTYLSDLWSFDPTAARGKQWQSRTPLRSGGRSHAGLFVVNNRAYLGGGRSIFVRNNNLDFLIFSDFWMYTPETN